MKIKDALGWINIYRNSDFIAIAPIDLSVIIYSLDEWHSADIDDAQFGNLIIESLDKSLAYVKEIFKNGRRERGNYEEWIKATKEKFGYKSDREMFVKMCCCNVFRMSSKIQFRIPEHVKLKRWDGSLETFFINATSDPVEIGRHARLAIDKAFSFE